MTRRWLTAFAAVAAITATGLPLVSAVESASANVTPTTNTIEDNFGRADQSAWGTTTNDQQLSNVNWGSDGAGANASIVSKSGILAYPGTNHIRMATAGSTAFAGGDALAEISTSAVGHDAPFVAVNACSDTTCGYMARLLTTTNVFQIGKRVADTLTVEASTAFTYAANTLYWVRVNYNSSTQVVSATIWADGSSEPGSPTLTWTDTGTVLGDNLPATGVSWPSAGTGETTTTDCFAYSSNPAVKAAKCDINRFEDNFTRTNQTGLGTSSNAGGVSTYAWGTDGTASPFSIASNLGVMAYPGAINTGKYATLSPTTFSGGDALMEFSVSNKGAVLPYVLLNTCSDKSCAYLARVNTSNNHLEIARRSASVLTVPAFATFSISANTLYWVRLNFDSSTGIVSAKAWADGASEPSSWMVTYTDGSPLSSGLVGVGGTWNATGTGQQINYACFSYKAVASISAKPCQSSTGVVVAAPSVVTGSATALTQNTATLNGTVDPNGASTTYQFEYGTTTSYGSVSPSTAGSAGSGSTAVPESTNISGLTANTTYHYRLNATNSQGTTHGSDQVFTTSSSTQHKVLFIPLENTSRSTALANMTYIWTLANTYGQATKYQALAHPSLPNYLGIMGGSMFSVTTDCSVGDVGCVPTAPSVFGQYAAASLTVKAYQEGMTSNCKTGAVAGVYAARHSPWPYWTDTTERAACNSDDVSMGTTTSGNLDTDLDAGTLPDLSEVTANLCNIGHGVDPPQTCGTGWNKYTAMDNFLQTWVPDIMAGPDYQNGNLTIIITMDESDSGDTDFTVPFVVIDPRLHGVTVTGTGFNHYSLTKWFDDNGGLTELRNAATASDLRSAFGL